MERTGSWKGWCAACVVALLAACWLQLAAGPMHDKIYRLASTHMWLQTGKLLYDVNLPLILYLYALPVYVAEHTGLPDHALLGALGVLWSGAALYLSMRMLASHPQLAQDAGKRRAAGCMLAYLFVYMPHPGFFFEREHILFVSTLPYVFQRMPGLAGAVFSRRLRISIGLLAAIGFCMKPHSVILWLLQQGLAWRRDRSWSGLVGIENLLIYAGAALCLTSVAMVMPVYFTTVLPMALLTYAACASPVLTNFLPACIVLLLGAAIMLVDFRWRRRTPYRSDLFHLLALMAGYLLYAFFNNGWVYTFYPAAASLQLAALWIWWEYGWLRDNAQPGSREVKKYTQGRHACGVLLLACFLVVTLQQLNLVREHRFDQPPLNVQPLLATLKRTDGRVTRFGAISMDFTFWFDAARWGNGRWVLRFPHFWMLPKFAKSDSAFTVRHHDMLDRVATITAEDMERNRPDIMYVDISESAPFVRRKVDMLAYFLFNPRFSAAWAEYRYDGTVSVCMKKTPYYGCRFAIYRRRTAPE